MSEIVNQLIEEKLFGNQCVWFSYVNGELVKGKHGEYSYLKVIDKSQYLGYGDVPDYWNDVEHAFRIVKKLNLTVTPCSKGNGWKVFHSNTFGFDRDIRWIGTTNNKRWTESKYLTEAICLEALNILNIKF